MSFKEFPLDISAIVIDLDGTLLHTAPELAEAANRMLRDMGRPRRVARLADELHRQRHLVAGEARADR